MRSETKMKRYIICFFILVTIINTGLGNNNRKELIEKRTYCSKTFENEDGTLTTEVSLGYWHYRNAAGKLEEIEPDFIASQRLGWDYQVTKGFYNVYMKNDISQGNAVTFETIDGFQIRSNLQALAYLDIASKKYKVLQKARSGKAMINGNKILYPDVFKRVDVKYTYKSTRLKEEIIISQDARNALPDPELYGLDAANTYLVVITKLNVDTKQMKYFVNNKDITQEEYEGEKRIEFRNLAGELKFFFPVDVAFLQNEEEIPEYQIKVRKRMIHIKGERYLLSGVPIQWINSAPQGTIVLDPQIAIRPDGTAGKDAIVRISYKPGEESWKNTNYGDVSYLSAAAWTRNGKGFYRRSYFQFNLSFLPEGANINSATLNLYVGPYQHGGGNDYRRSLSSSYLRRVTESWDEHRITWTNQPAAVTTNQLSIPAPATIKSDFTLDVTQLIKDMLNTNNYGFL